MRSIVQWENVGKIKQLTVTEMKWIFKHVKKFTNSNGMPFLPIMLAKLTKLNNRLLARF